MGKSLVNTANNWSPLCSADNKYEAKHENLFFGRWTKEDRSEDKCSRDFFQTELELIIKVVAKKEFQKIKPPK